MATKTLKARTCPICGNIIPAGSGNRRRYCSIPCRQKAYRKRKQIIPNTGKKQRKIEKL